MTLERVGRIRTVRALRAAVATGLALSALSGCGKSGAHTQSPTSDLPSSSSAPSTPSTSTSATGKPSASPISGIPTPSVTPPAQSAVDAYIALANAYNRASVDPTHADLAEINKHLGGKALMIFDNSIKTMRSAGKAYRGTPGDPRVKVQTVFSATSVFLASCPAYNNKDPFVEYYVATGKPVPVAKRNPPPPYLLTLPMQLIGSQWKLVDLLQNVGKTCG